MAVRTTFHDGCNPCHEFVDVFLTHAATVCVYLPLLIQNNVCKISSEKLQSTIYVISNGHGMFPLIYLKWPWNIASDVLELAMLPGTKLVSWTPKECPSRVRRCHPDICKVREIHVRFLFPPLSPLHPASLRTLLHNVPDWCRCRTVLPYVDF